MHFIITAFLSTLLVSGIRGEAEPLTGNPLFKDGVHHEYLFHHGHHNSGNDRSPTGGSVGIGQLIPDNQIHDQSVASQDPASQVGQSGQIGQTGQGGQVGQSVVSGMGPSSVPFVGQRADIPFHLGARAIGSPIAYYPYLGKTFASPYYSQYQPTVPYNGVYPQFYPYSYSVSPYSASPYSSPVSASAYPGYFGYNQGYNQGYVPQYYSGYPSYQTSGEIQSVSKQ